MRNPTIARLAVFATSIVSMPTYECIRTVRHMSRNAENGSRLARYTLCIPESIVSRPLSIRKVSSIMIDHNRMIIVSGASCALMLLSGVVKCRSEYGYAFKMRVAPVLRWHLLGL